MRAFLILTGAFLWAMPQPIALVNDVRRSSDASWLERLASDVRAAEQEYAARGRNVGGAKGVRQTAFVRLGELATPASLEAVRRIESAQSGRPVLPPAIVPDGWKYHPASHMGEDRWRMGSTSRLSDGREVAAFVMDLHGAGALYIATKDGERWSRPRLVPQAVMLWATAAVRELRPGRLRAELASRTAPKTPLLQLPLTPDAFEFDLDAIERDTDDDGWTDVEEDWIGLSWRSADTDRDGFRDGHDSTPTLEAKREQVDAAEATILRRAIFAMFGLTSAPHALFVREGSPRVDLIGLPGPVLYRDAGIGVRVTWKILNRTSDEATVEITDYVGPLAASGSEVRLRRIGGEWYVTTIRGLWIS